MRNYVSLIYLGINYTKFLIYNYLCKLLFLIELWLLNIPHGKILTGGGVVKIRKSRHGTIILGNNVNFANKWEIGYPVKCFLRVAGNGIIRIGDNSGLNSCQLFCNEAITIGRNVLIGGGTIIFDTNFHSSDYLERRDPILNGRASNKGVVIKDDVFVGGRCIIYKGVTIGERSMIAAGSVVIKSVPADELWGGNPAKFIKKIN